MRADKLIGDIHRQRKIAFKESEKAEKARSEARRLERDLADRLEKIGEERQKVLEQARAEGELEVEVLKTQLKMLKSELKKARQPLEAVQAIEEKIEVLTEQIERPARSKMQGERPVGVLKPGDKVALRELGTEGVISSIDGEEAEVQAGPLRLRVRLEELKRKAEEIEAVDKKQATSKKVSNGTENPSIRHTYLSSSPGMELDLRGQRAEDALEMLDRYLEKASMAGLPFVRIIHGKGTGKLRQEVRAALKDHPQVASFEEGGPKEGGEGVTVAKLADG